VGTVYRNSQKREVSWQGSKTPIVSPRCRSSSLLNIPPAVAKRMKQAGSLHGLRPFAIWTLSLAKALERANGDWDVAIPTVVSGRSGHTTVDAIGCFINTVYARCRLTSGVPLKQIFDEFVDSFSRALLMQHTPRQLVHRRLGWQQSVAAIPNVFLSYHSWHDDVHFIQNRETKRIVTSSGDLRVALSLDVTRTRSPSGEDKTVARLSYDPTLITRSAFDQFRSDLLREIDLWSCVAIETQ